MLGTPDLLRSKGLKVTPQRIAIMDMLMNTYEHPTAETIFRTLAPTNPTMSLATVYKTLDAFNQANLIQALTIDGESLHYDYNTEFHPHIICEKCHSVKDINVDINSEISEIVENVNSKTNHNINKTQLFFYGTCDECLK